MLKKLSLFLCCWALLIGHSHAQISTGGGISLSGGGGGGGGTLALTSYPTMADLRAVSAVGLGTGATVELNGNLAVNDGGGGVYDYQGAATNSDDNGAYVRPSNNPGAGRWVRRMDNMGGVPLQVWGAKNSPTIDNSPTSTSISTTAIQNAFNWAGLNNGSLYCSGVFYADTITVTGTVKLNGPGILPTPSSNVSQGGTSCELRKSPNGSTASAVGGGSIPAGTYFLRVYAYDGAGATGNILKVIPVSTAGVVLTGGNASVTAAWPAIAGAASYKVYISSISTPINTVACPTCATSSSDMFSSSTTTDTTITFTSIPTNPGLIASLDWITPGSAYTAGTYTNVALTGGSGTGATADITVSSIGVVTAAVINNPGSGYTWWDQVSAAAANIGGTGTGFTTVVYTLAMAPDWIEPNILIPYATTNFLNLAYLRVNGSGRASHSVYFADDPSPSHFAESFHNDHTYMGGSIIGAMYSGEGRYVGISNGSEYYGGRYAVMFKNAADHRLWADQFAQGKGVQGDECGIIMVGTNTSAFVGAEIYSSWCGVFVDSVSKRNKQIGADVDRHYYYGMRSLGEHAEYDNPKMSAQCLGHPASLGNLCMDISVGNRQTAINSTPVFVVGAGVNTSTQLPNYNLYFETPSKATDSCPTVLVGVNLPNLSGVPYLTAFTNSNECTTLSRQRTTINLNNVVLPTGDTDNSLHIGQANGLNNRVELDAFRNGISTVSPRLTMRNHNGTAAVPTHINIATDLALLEFEGDTDSGSALGGIIKCRTTEQFSDTANGTKCMGLGTANTTTAQTTALQWQRGVWVGAPAADPTLIRGELGFEKVTDPAAAPGAGSCKLTVTAGTGANTCKILAYCGTSTTPAVLADNIGGGC